MKNVSELEGTELDYWVAKAESGYQQVGMKSGDVPMWNFANITKPMIPVSRYHPSTDWSQGGTIIEREGITTKPHVVHNGKITSWSAGWEWPMKGGEDRYCGPTPLIAAMRAHVERKFGEEIEECSHA